MCWTGTTGIAEWLIAVGFVVSSLLDPFPMRLEKAVDNDDQDLFQSALLATLRAGWPTNLTERLRTPNKTSQRSTVCEGPLLAGCGRSSSDQSTGVCCHQRNL